MSNVGYATLTIMPSLKGLAAGIRGQAGPGLDSEGKNSGKRMGGAMSTGILGSLKGIAGPIAAIAAGSAATSFLKDAVSEASNLQEAGTKLSAIFGPAVGEIEKFAGAGAKGLGQSNLAIKDATATFGLYGKAAGLAGSENVKFSTDLTTLSTDLASFYNSSPEEAVEAIGSALRGETEPMRKFGVMLDAASLSSEALRMGLIKTTKDALTPQQKTLAAQSLIMKQTAVAQGDFAKTSGGLANQQRILNAQWADAKGKIGGFLLPAVTSVVTALNTHLGPAITSTIAFVQRMGPGFAVVRDAVGATVAAVVGFVTGLTAGTGPATGAIASISGAASSLKGMLVGLWGEFQVRLMPALATFGSFVVTVVVPALARMAAFIATNVIPVYLAIYGVITGQILPILMTVAGYIIGTLVPALFAIVSAIASRLAPVFAALSQTIQTQVMPALRAALAKFNEWWPTIRKVISVVVMITGKILVFAAAILGKVLPPVIRFAGFMIGTFIGSIVRSIGAVVNIIASLIRFGSAVGTAGAKVGAFASLVGSKISQVVGFVAGLPGRIAGAFGGVGGLLSGAGRAIMDGLLGGLQAGFAKVKAMVSNIAGWIAANKGPISYDRKLLIPHGRAVMAGLNEGLNVGMGGVKKTVHATTDLIASVGGHATPVRGSEAGTVRQASTSGGPLIGSLTVQSTGNLHSDLDAVEFRLRSFARGGVNA